MISLRSDERCVGPGLGLLLGVLDVGRAVIFLCRSLGQVRLYRSDCLFVVSGFEILCFPLYVFQLALTLSAIYVI